MSPSFAAARGCAHAPRARRRRSTAANSSTPAAAQFVEALGDRLLVADDRGVLRPGVALAVEHRAVRRQRSVDRELLGGPAARARDVVGDAHRQRGGDPHRGLRPARLGGRLHAASGRRVRRASWVRSSTSAFPPCAAPPAAASAGPARRCTRPVSAHRESAATRASSPSPRPRRRAARPAAAAGRRGTRASGAPACPEEMPHICSVTMRWLMPMPRVNRPPRSALSVSARCASCVGCWTWIGTHTRADLDGVDLAKGDGERWSAGRGRRAAGPSRPCGSPRRAAWRGCSRVASTGDVPPVSLSNPTRLRLICMLPIEAPDGEKLRAPCCRRVGGSDGNTELTGLSTAPARPLQPCRKILDTPWR